MVRKPTPPLGRPAGTSPRYLRLAAQLRARMESGAWARGSILPSFQTLVRRYRVGERVVRTAVEALKREGWVTANARRRLVVTAPETASTTAGGVVLEILTNNLRAFVSSATQYSAELQRGILMGAGELDAPLLIAHSGNLRVTQPLDLLRVPLRGIVLFWPSRREMLPPYARLRVPVVLIDRPYPEWKLHAASVDNFGAAREATERLIALGHRRIAFLSYLVLWKSEPDPDALERRAGFTAAMKAAGLWTPGNRIFHSSDYDHPGSVPLKAFLRAHPPFTAVLATDANRANLVMQAARIAGREVPRDLSVVAFQGLHPTHPALSGPRVDFAELARRGVLLLKEPRRPGIHLRQPAVWHPGETVGPPSA